MTNLEKTLAGLEFARNFFQGRADMATPGSDGHLLLLGSMKACANAAELLKAQEPNEDWISRKRLKDEIQYYIDEAGWGDEANKVLGWCMEFIDNQRAVKWE